MRCRRPELQGTRTCNCEVSQIKASVEKVCLCIEFLLAYLLFQADVIGCLPLGCGLILDHDLLGERAG